MFSLQFMLLAAASLLSLGLLQPVHGASITDESLNTATITSCLEELNAARWNVGLSSFRGAEMSLRERVGKGLHDICARVAVDLESQEVDLAEHLNLMVAPQEGPEVDCRAAVDYWISAVNDYDNVLPPYFANRTPPYNTLKYLSFIRLFMLRRNPLVGCFHITCNAGSTEAEVPSNAKDVGGDNPLEVTEDGNSQVTVLRGSKSRKIHRLVCLTTGGLIEGEAPYEPELWEVVVGILKQRARSSAP